MRLVYSAVVLLLVFLEGVNCHIGVEIIQDGQPLVKRDINVEDYEDHPSDIWERKAALAEKMWPNNDVPYELDESVTKEDECRDIRTDCAKLTWACDMPENEDFVYSQCRETCKKCGGKIATKIEEAMKSYELYTCLKFRPKTDADKNYVRFVNNGYKTGCYSQDVGKFLWESGQDINIASFGCETYDTILHEIGHAVGLFHEQMRPDRDDYLIIHLDNVKAGKESQFTKVEASKVNLHGVPYDYMSIMQYGQYSFSKEYGKAITIETKDKYYQTKIGTAKALSMRDIEILNKMYQCPSAWYRLHHIATGKVMDSYQGVSLWDKDGSDYQLWGFDGKKLRNKQFPDLVFSMAKDSGDFADVVMEAPNTGKNQEWEHLRKGFENEWDRKGYALGVKDGKVGCYSTKNEKDPNQQWTFEKV